MSNPDRNENPIMTVTQKLNAEAALVQKLTEDVTEALKAGVGQEATAAILERIKSLVEEGDD